jgi:hypothetical protein
LKAITEPETIFYKDEGGKGNCLSFTVGLEGVAEHEFEPFALRVSLFFESEELVSEQSIFTLCGNQFDPPTLKSFDEKVLINFRIEKVSRRKDGQRFKIFVEPDTQKHPHAVDIAGVFCNAISVLSKRKSRSSSSSHEKRRKVLDLSSGLSEMEKRMSAQISCLQATTVQLLDLVQQQNERMVCLETTLKHMAGQKFTENEQTIPLNLNRRKPRMPMKRSSSALSNSSLTSDSKISDSAADISGSSCSGSDCERLDKELIESSRSTPGLPLSMVLPSRAHLRTFGSSGSLINLMMEAAAADGSSSSFKVDSAVLKIEPPVSSSLDDEISGGVTRPTLRGVISSGFEFTFD